MIEVENLTKFYGTHQALNDVNFTVEKGEVLGFLGPNGAGKSTTMKIITGFLSPTEGAVRVDGMDIVDDSLEARKRIGYLPEHPPLYLDMSVKNYLEFTGRIRGIGKKHLQSSVESVVEKCGLQKYYKSQCSALSKGYRQRVGIAQAMIHEPMVLILDEPTIGLDPIQIVEIRQLIKSFGGDHTVVLSTHILPEVDMTCERVVIISDGTVVTEGSTTNIRENLPGNNQLELKIKGTVGSFKERLEEFEGVDAVTVQPMALDVAGFRIETDEPDRVSPGIARLVVENNLELIELRNLALTLEEIFIKVTMN